MIVSRTAAGMSAALALLLFAGVTLAQVSGVCSNCHTMHNSQNGSSILSTGPQPSLLTSDCVGCHSDDGSVSIIGSTPIVFNRALPNAPLAGGNFYWVAQSGGDEYGHNVLGISGPDNNLARAPGKNAGCSTGCHSSLAQPAVMSWPSTGDVENGCRGCHTPQHHADDSAVVVDGNGGWYRFLGVVPLKKLRYLAQETGVIGIEAADWEENASSGSHNVYQGTTAVYANGSNYGDATLYIHDNSIGSFCAGCHGEFHDRMNDAQGISDFSIAGAWIRHPSDVLIPVTGEYSGYETYDPVVPAARSNVIEGDRNFTTIDHTRDVVTCISCHRAHGSPYPDMLRWDYQNGCEAGTENSDCGCFTCHNAKDGVP